MPVNIPEYKGDGFFGRNREFWKNPLLFSYEKQKVLGDFYYSTMLFKKIFYISNLEVVKHVLQTNQKNYVKSPAYDQLRLALGNGLLTSEGAFWRKQRRLMQPTFYKSNLEELVKKMIDVAEQYCDDLQGRLDQTFSLSKEMMSLTADIVLATLYSSVNKQDQTELYNSMTSSQEYIMYRTHNPHLIPFTYINGKHTRFKRNLKKFDDSIYEMVEERKAKDEYPADLLSMLLQAKDADTGEGMSGKQLRDELITLFAAGHETSANALSWTFYLLLKNPKIIEKLREEIDTKSGDKITVDDLRNLSYTRQVLEESMRMYPPAWAVGRQNVEEDEILGCTIPARSIIFISIYAIHYHPELWDNPEEFNPDRFSKEASAERPKLAYMPFGSGPRMCIGNHFAMMEMQLILALLIKRFDFKFVEDKEIEMLPLVTLKPKTEIVLELSKRSNVTIES